MKPKAEREPTSKHNTFDLAGNFGGFVLTPAGKRRLVLRIDGVESLFKVPRLLRRQLIGRIRIGQRLQVSGTDEAVANDHGPKRTVARIVIVDVEGALDAARKLCTIRVCAKKNCWRNGGQKVWNALDREILARGFSDTMKLKAVGCLDRCKQAPNVDLPRHEYQRCTVRDVQAIVDDARGAAPR